MSYYTTLGVSKTASHDEIKKAYRKLSLQYHPDRNSGNDDKFKTINEAYETLGDGDKKHIYDRQQNNPLSGMFANQSDVNNVHRNMMSGSDMFQELFSDILNQHKSHGTFSFGGNVGQNRSPNIRVFHNGIPVNIGRQPSIKPEPIHINLEVTLNDIFHQCEKTCKYSHYKIDDSNTKIIVSSHITFNIPGDTINGKVIKLVGEGHNNNGERGDLVITLTVNKHETFEKQDDDIVMSKNISLLDALTGFVMTFTHISGKQYSINNSPGNIIQPNYQKSINGLGFRKKDNNSYGNLIVKFYIDFPKSLSVNRMSLLKQALE